MHFAREGADVAILYLNEHDDAKETEALVQREGGRKCLLFAGDVGDEKVGAVALSSAAGGRVLGAPPASNTHTHTHKHTRHHINTINTINGNIAPPN